MALGFRTVMASWLDAVFEREKADNLLLEEQATEIRRQSIATF